jgi:hypothetical protein
MLNVTEITPRPSLGAVTYRLDTTKVMGDFQISFQNPSKIIQQ